MSISTLPDTIATDVQRGEQMYIGGQRLDAASGETFSVFDPATGAILAEVASGGAAEVDRAVSAAREAFSPQGPWRSLTPQERGKLIWRLADLIEVHATRLAQIDSLDSGKPINEMLYFDIPFSVDTLRYYAGWTTKITGSTIALSYPASHGAKHHAYTLKEPVGVVAAIVPWNLPLLMAIKKIAPALAAGCTIVVKPAEQTPLSMAVLAELVEEAGFPTGVFNYVTGLGETVGAALVDHPDVNKVSFTGSVETGKAIVRGAAGNLKRVSLELGGKSPNIVFDDADLDEVIAASTAASFICQGESCIAGSRLYVQRGLYQQVVERMAQQATSIKLGSGLDQTTQMGPLISAEHRERVLGYIQIGVEEGAEIVAGGKAWGDEGYFTEPTVLINARQDSRVMQEEIFGPVVSIVPFDTEDEVVGLANDTRFGLGAAVWTRDISRAHRMAVAIESGQVWINCYQACDSAMPFGGTKESGWGRETCAETLDEYLEIKSVVVAL